MAYSFLHTSEKDNTVELGWCGTHNTENVSLLKLLIFKQAMYANTHGYSFFQGEFDSTSIYAMEILKSFPFNPCATWITYQRNRKVIIHLPTSLCCFYFKLYCNTTRVYYCKPIYSFIYFMLFSINLSFTSSNAFYAAVLSYTLLIQLHVPVGADYLLRSTYLRLYGDDILLQK